MGGSRSGVKKLKSGATVIIFYCRYAARPTIEKTMPMMPQIQWIVDCRVADKQTAQLNVVNGGADDSRKSEFQFESESKMRHA